MATVTVTKDSFEPLVKDNKVVILDFWAEWCGPCRGFAPVFEAASEKYNEVAFGKVNVDNEGDLAMRFGVRQIPTIVAFRDGEVVHTQVGALPGTALDTFVNGICEMDYMDESSDK